MPIASEGGGDAGPFHPKSERRKNKTGIISQEYISSEKRQKSQEYILKIMKKSIFHRDFDKKSQNFVTIFQNFIYFGPNAEGFAGTFLTLDG